MKKFEQELERELEQAMNEVLPKPDPSRLDKFDGILERNKKLRPRIVVFRRTALACILILVATLSCLIPIWMNNNDDDPPVRYYGDDNTVKVELTQEFVQDYINKNISNYNFIFEDCSVSDILGIYQETSTELLAISMLASKTDTPVIININIVLNKNYTYSDHSKYIKDAEVEELENMKIYTREFNNVNYSLYTLIDRPTYYTYLVLNINDSEILSKFKTN